MMKHSCLNTIIKIQFIIFISVLTANAQTKPVIKNQATASVSTSASTQTPEAREEAHSKSIPKPPALKPDEYAVFYNDQYQVFKTKKQDKLEFSTNCFKNNKLDCEAFRLSQLKNVKLAIKDPEMQNWGALYCDAIFGRNLIALDQKGNQYNFCRFQDGSMVNSWSLYFKAYPINTVK